MLNCSLCTGWWVAGGLAWFYDRSLLGWVTIAALGHMITLVREKWLPCNSCEGEIKPQVIKRVVHAQL